MSKINISIDNKRSYQFLIETDADVSQFGWETKEKFSSYYMNISPWNLSDLFLTNKTKLGHTIIYEDKIVKDDKIKELSNAIKDIVSKETKIKEVFVYGDSPKIKIDIAPIEIFIEMSATAIKYKDKLFKNIKNSLSTWKKENKFNYSINLTLIPMDWIFETNI